MTQPVYTEPDVVDRTTQEMQNATEDAAEASQGKEGTASDERFANLSHTSDEDEKETRDSIDENADTARDASHALEEGDDEGASAVDKEDSRPGERDTTATSTAADRPSLPSKDDSRVEDITHQLQDAQNKDDAAAAQQAQQQQAQQQAQQDAQRQAQIQAQQQAAQQQAEQMQQQRQQAMQQQMEAQQQAQQQAAQSGASGLQVGDDGGMTLTRDQLEQIIDQVNSEGGGGDIDNVEWDSDYDYENSLDGAERGDGSGDVPFQLGETSDQNTLDPSEVTFEQDPEDATLSSDELSDVVDAAMDANGITDPDARAKWGALMEYVSEHESGGHVNALNEWDSNAHGDIVDDGAPFNCSRGNWQTIPTTFAANHVEGTSTSIYDPTASCAAAINYIMDRYNCDPSSGGVDAFYNDRYPTYKGY